MTARGGLLVALLLCAASSALADDSESRLQSVVQPYVDAGRFSGAILVVKDGAIVFDRAYGMADAARGIPNRPSTGFHVGTLSMQYTALAILHLADDRKLTLDNTADQFVPGAPAAPLRNLLAVAPDAPEAIGDYELLARVAEAASGKSFADVLDAEAVASVWMSGTGLDDGALADESRIAKGYAAGGDRASADWRALTGAASLFTTTRDELHWLDRLFGDASAATRRAMFAAPAGYGWFHGQRLGEESYWMTGRAPGFTSYVWHGAGLTVIVLANIGAAPAEEIGNGLAAGILGHGDGPIEP